MPSVQMSDQPIRPEKFFSQLQAPGVIQREYGNGGPAGRCQTMNIRAPVNKVIRPQVSPVVKQSLHVTRHRVNTTQIRAFVQIAAMASESEIPISSLPPC